jgi:ribokinase
MSQVLVFGSINMDLVVETGTFPQIGETLPGASFCDACRREGANQAVAVVVAAARLGAHVTMLGQVGSDAFDAEIRWQGQLGEA